MQAPMNRRIKMADISNYKEQQDKLIAERDELKDNIRENSVYVESVAEQAKFRTGRVAPVIIIAAVVAIAATLAIDLLISGAPPVLMWATVGVPTAVAVVSTLIEANRSEKLKAIYNQLFRELSSNEARVYTLDREINALEERIIGA